MLQNSTVFNAQNAGNRISELLDFKFFLGACTTEPPRGKGPCSPFSGHSCLLRLQWLFITKVIETLHHVSSVTSFPKYQKFPSQITTTNFGTSWEATTWLQYNLTSPTENNLCVNGHDSDSLHCTFNLWCSSQGSFLGPLLFLS